MKSAVFVHPLVCILLSWIPFEAFPWVPDLFFFIFFSWGCEIFVCSQIVDNKVFVTLNWEDAKNVSPSYNCGRLTAERKILKSFQRNYIKNTWIISLFEFDSTKDQRQMNTASTISKINTQILGFLTVPKTKVPVANCTGYLLLRLDYTSSFLKIPYIFPNSKFFQISFVKLEYSVTADFT